MYRTDCLNTLQDNYLYSVNYSHYGADKQWYGVPAGMRSCLSSFISLVPFHNHAPTHLSGHAKRVERACATMFPLLFKENPDQMQHMTLQVSPSQLLGWFHGLDLT
jgi:hypothetical protein